MSLQIITLRGRGKLFHILHNTVHMLLQCIQRVLEVLIMVLLLGPLVVGLAGDVELFGGSGVVVLQDFVEEDVPDLCRLIVCRIIN